MEPITEADAIIDSYLVQSDGNQSIALRLLTCGNSSASIGGSGLPREDMPVGARMSSDAFATDITDRIPLDVLGRWLSNDAIKGIDRFFGPIRRAHQVDQELDPAGLFAG